MQKFVTMIGWKDEMVELITKQEGEFKIVSITNVLLVFRVSDQVRYKPGCTATEDG